MLRIIDDRPLFISLSMNPREIRKPPTADSSLPVHDLFDPLSDSLDREYDDWFDRQMYLHDDRGFYHA